MKDKPVNEGGNVRIEKAHNEKGICVQAKENVILKDNR